MVGILSLSFVAFRAISEQMQTQKIDPVYDRFDEMQLESARNILQSSGEAGAEELPRPAWTASSAVRIICWMRGQGSGLGRRSVGDAASTAGSEVAHSGLTALGNHAPLAGRQFWFAAEGQAVRRDLVVSSLLLSCDRGDGILCWIAAAGVISPIRKIATSIALFGQGNLSVRVETDRDDEIGQLGRSFNEMAERLERLIVSERRLLGDISHELRSPLARLKFAMKLARTSSDSTAALERIERDVDRIASLVADIVEINVVEDDPALQDTREICVRDIIEEVVRDCGWKRRCAAAHRSAAATLRAGARQSRVAAARR